MELDEYQRAAHASARSTDIEIFTLGLFGEAGSVASAIKKLKRDNEAEEVVRAEIATELGDLLWYLAEISTYYGHSLSEIATANLAKTDVLFSGSDECFDERAPVEERLPRRSTFEFVVGDDQKVTIIRDGEKCGDPLDDNSYVDDDYKFHDVFHLAYMARLGWSPVMRKLMGKKRRYDPDVDRVEDGARAIFLEEGISVFIFNQNEKTNAGVSEFSDRRNIPFNILSSIKVMTRGLEVGVRDVSAWRDAIAMGFECFDWLVKNGGGRIECDLDAKRLRTQDQLI